MASCQSGSLTGLDVGIGVRIVNAGNGAFHHGAAVTRRQAQKGLEQYGVLRAINILAKCRAPSGGGGSLVDEVCSTLLKARHHLDQLVTLVITPLQVDRMVGPAILQHVTQQLIGLLNRVDMKVHRTLDLAAAFVGRPQRDFEGWDLDGFPLGVGFTHIAIGQLDSPFEASLVEFFCEVHAAPAEVFFAEFSLHANLSAKDSTLGDASLELNAQASSSGQQLRTPCLLTLARAQPASGRAVARDPAGTGLARAEAAKCALLGLCCLAPQPGRQVAIRLRASLGHQSLGGPVMLKP